MMAINLKKNRYCLRVLSIIDKQLETAIHYINVDGPKMPDCSSVHI